MAISDELRINKSVKGLPSTDWLAGKIEKYVEGNKKKNVFTSIWLWEMDRFLYAEDQEQAVASGFKDVLHEIKGVAEPKHYVSALNQLWQSVCKALKPNPVTKEPTAAHTRRGKRLIQIIEQELLALRAEGIPVRKYYLRYDLTMHDNILPEFLFYKNEFEPKGRMQLGIRELEKLGIPDDEGYEEWCMEGPGNRNTNILSIWKNSEIRIRKPQKLYEFQKDLVKRCTVDVIRQAARCGIFPEPMRELLMEYALQEIEKEKYPVLIWIVGGGVDEKG